MGWGGRFDVGDKAADVGEAIHAAFRKVQRETTDAAFGREEGKALEFSKGDGLRLSIPAEQVDASRSASKAWFQSVLHKESKRRSTWGNWIMELATHPEEMPDKVNELKADHDRLAFWLS